MSTPTTALMPLDPAVSPQRAARILPIRADLLPSEITSGRHARRAGLLLAAAVLLVIAVMGAWYFYANLQRSQAEDDLASVTEQVDRTRSETRRKEYKTVTDVINQSGTITRQLSDSLATDLPWATLTTAIRTTGTTKRATVTSIVGSLGKDQATGTAPSDTIGTMTIAGRAADKKTIAGFVDALGSVDGLANVYLTAANQDDDAMTFTLTADITRDALCGRFTTKCKSGGN